MGGPTELLTDSGVPEGENFVESTMENEIFSCYTI